MSEPRSAHERKVRPPEPAVYHVGRPRLRAAIEDAVERHPVLVVAATAGAGKTSAVAEWVASTARRVAWLHLGPGDTAPGRLLTCLERSLARQWSTAEGAVAAALRRGFPHLEAARQLLDACGDHQTIVLDGLEQLDAAPDARAFVDGLAGLAGDTTRLVLITRVGDAAPPRGSPAGVARIGDGELAFTAPEAAELLQRIGASEVDAGVAVRRTGGWVAGVLFEAWRAAGHRDGMGGEADGLNGYLSTRVLSGLQAADREFLVTTALLEEVSEADARGLGIEDAPARMASLRGTRLPLSWSDDGAVLRCHPRFREHLQKLLVRRGAEEVRRLRLRWAEQLVRRGRDEDATEVLLATGEPALAIAPAERAIVGVMERLDLGVVERWLGELRPGISASALTVAELMLALARGDIGHGTRLGDQLADVGLRDELVRTSETAAWTLGWCYLHNGRREDVDQILSVAPPGPAADAIVYAAQAMTDADAPVARPPLRGQAMDAFVYAATFCLGRLSQLAADTGSEWAHAVATPWRIAAHRATGATSLALELCERAAATGLASNLELLWVKPEVLLDAGRPQEARALVDEGRRLAAATGSLGYQAMNAVTDLKLRLRAEDDPRGALEVLDRPELRRAAQHLRFVAESLDTWAGLALLRLGRDADALSVLDQAVARMLRGGRLLELPTAAVYLSEAAWRTGDEALADRAAELARDAADQQGSTHALLQALCDLPAVVSRRLDLEATGDSEWHRLGRVVRERIERPLVSGRGRVHLRDMGRLELLVDGAAVRPRVGKCHELVAYLALRNGHRVRREELLRELFAGRQDNAAKTYLRRTLHCFWHLLPPDVERGGGADAAGVPAGLVVTSDSGDLEARLVEVRAAGPHQRFHGLLALAQRAGDGEYLPGISSAWAEERRRALRRVVEQARLEAADLALQLGRLDAAAGLADEVLQDDPLVEAAWRVRMRVCGALGDEQGVLDAYRALHTRLRDIGAAPSRTTEDLLQRLR